ncbi:MAG: hypothetical protein ABJA37_12145, partial [Ferruginibacter sp.]
MKKEIIYLSVVLLFFSCQLPPRQHDVAVSKSLHILGDKVNPNEEYVMITTAVNMPMYVSHDQDAFLRWGKKMGVK